MHSGPATPRFPICHTVLSSAGGIVHRTAYVVLEMPGQNDEPNTCRRSPPAVAFFFEQFSPTHRKATVNLGTRVLAPKSPLCHPLSQEPGERRVHARFWQCMACSDARSWGNDWVSSVAIRGQNAHQTSATFCWPRPGFTAPSLGLIVGGERLQRPDPQPLDKSRSTPCLQIFNGVRDGV